MKNFKRFVNILLVFYHLFSDTFGGFCGNSVRQLPKPHISHLEANNERKTLSVRWLVNRSGIVSDIYEIQVARSENFVVVYSRNISLFSVHSGDYTWTWTSDLPLECVNHSVRMRRFYNQCVSSPWSTWETNYGAQVKDKTKMFPFQQMLREGTSARFCCIPPSGVNITNITLSNKNYPLIDVGAGVKAIAVDNLTIPTNEIQAVLLGCKDEIRQMSWWTWNYVSFPPPKPRNLSCVTSDLTTVTCAWDSGRKRQPHHRNNQTQTLHIDNSDQRPIDCKLSSCTFQAVPLLEEYNITLVVKDQLGEATESYSFNIRDRAVPVVEWYRVNPGVKTTTVLWMVHGNLTRQNLLCQVSTDPGSTSEQSCDHTRVICKTELEQLLPHTRYSARVRCSVNGRLWGEWTKPLYFTTHPMVTLDVWRRIRQLSDHRQVTLFWNTHVRGSAAVVNIRGYIVEWSQAGKNWSKWTDSVQTQTEVSLGSGHYDFTVKAVLNTSSISAHISVPQKHNGDNHPVEKRLRMDTGAGFNLSWEEQENATCGYIVEWCILGNAVPCTLRWMKVEAGCHTLSLPARNFKAGCRYTFNIYGCAESGHRLLEIQSGYARELQTVQPPSLLEPLIAFSSVTLEWWYNEDDQAHPAFITGYLATVHVVEHDKPLDHAILFNVSVADPHRKSVTIDGLQQNQEYVFSVSALTKQGPGQAATVTIRTRTNHSADFAKILTPVLFMLCCTIVLWLKRKVLKTVLAGIFVYPAGMNIKPLELDVLLHESDKRLPSQEVEECSLCDIEILTRPPTDDTTVSCNSQTLNLLLSNSFQSSASTSPPCIPIQADYCPQSVTTLFGGPALPQMTCLTNDNYFSNLGDDLSEAMDVENEPF